VDDVKKKEKEKPVKEEIKRPEKEVKKMETIAAKKPEPSVSPKKLQVSSLPVTRHRVSLDSASMIKRQCIPRYFLFHVFDRFIKFTDCCIFSFSF
jgi:hypothetical protein